jgi:hypothetical protein
MRGKVKEYLPTKMKVMRKLKNWVLNGHELDQNEGKRGLRQKYC